MNQVLINILISSASILLVSLSLSIQYSIFRFFNILHAAVITTGAYFIYLFVDQLKFSFIEALCIVFIAIVIVVYILSNILKNRLISLRNDFYKLTIISFGVYIVFQNCLSLCFGDEVKSLDRSIVEEGHNILLGNITNIQVIIIFSSILFFFLIYALINYSNLGRQFRAVAENKELSLIYGVSIVKISLISISISSLLGAVAGILIAYESNLSPIMGFDLLIFGIVAMIISGTGNIKGLVWGSVLIASIQNVVAYNFDIKWMNASTFFILIAFLIWKPLGFSGNRLKKIEI
jgi:branched-chain amino acid transport system permease protein